MDFAVPEDQGVKLKEDETRDKYLDLARELKTMEHEGDCDTNYNKSFVKWVEDIEIRAQVETIQTTASRSTRIPRRVLKIWEDLLLLKPLWKTIS